MLFEEDQMTTTYVVAAGVADIRRGPEPTSELVTQALMNVAAIGGQQEGQWTYVTLPDYEGWIHTDQLAEPITKGFCKVDETGSTALELMSVVIDTHTPLYTQAKGNETLAMVYLSTALPVLDMTEVERIQVALPGERSGWLKRSSVAIRQQQSIYPRTDIATVTRHARALLGRPYLWGGTSWEGIDCSGFVQLCYRMGGYAIPRDADQQHAFASRNIQRKEMREGDLIFFGSKEITHVALALNNSEYIHAEGQNYDRVVINSFDPAAEHYYPRLDAIVWNIKRVVL
ncbi:MAG: C40 family peptidase [Ktedonobacteraceae bacterium]